MTKMRVISKKMLVRERKDSRGGRVGKTKENKGKIQKRSRKRRGKMARISNTRQLLHRFWNKRANVKWNKGGQEGGSKKS